MQKQDFLVKFQPLPVPSNDTLYFDAEPVSLPYAEDFPMLHYHDKYEIGICYEGEGMFLSEGVFSYFSKGDVIFVPPNRHHYARSVRKSKPLICRFVYINIKTVENLLSYLSKDKEATSEVLTASKSYIPSVIHAGENPKLNSMLSDIIDTCSPGKQSLHSLVQLKTALFLYEAQNVFSNEIKKENEDCKSDASIDAVAEYISLNYDKNDSIADLASLCHLSDCQMRRRFVKIYGITPIAYRLQLRCKIAAELLSRTKFPIQRISNRVGFNDVSELYMAFKKHYGVPPSVYRAKNAFQNEK